MNALLHISDLHKSFEGRKILDGASLTLAKGSITLLTGDNGAGKTTLFNVITGVERAESGQILFNGTAISTMPPLRIAQLGIARLYQTPRLFKNLTAWENLACAAHANTGTTVLNAVFRPRFSKAQDHALKVRALALLERFGLGAAAHSSVHELSYGQQKLIALCMLEMNGCRLILLDEPLAGLAIGMVERVQHTIRQLQATGKSFFIIEHDIERAAGLADRQLRLEAGTLHELLPHG